MSNIANDPSISLIHDEEFWFNDGSIVLTAGSYGFRVHQSILARSSELFMDLFALPQSATASADATIDECPVVHLSGDHPDDVRYLLRVLYGGKQAFLENSLSVRPIPFANVAALVRLSHKYQIDDLRDATLERMQTCFIRNFWLWDGVCEKNGSNEMYFTVDDAITAVNLARLTNTPLILPTALYFCCQLSTETLLQGIQRSDGTTERLSEEDLKCCLDARPKLAQLSVILDNMIFRPMKNQQCTTWDTSRTCASLIERLRKTCNDRNKLCEVIDLDILKRRALSDSHSFHTSFGTVREGAEFCGCCRGIFVTRDNQDRAQVWAILPRIFRIVLDSWEDEDNRFKDSDTPWQMQRIIASDGIS